MPPVFSKRSGSIVYATISFALTMVMVLGTPLGYQRLSQIAFPLVMLLAIGAAINGYSVKTSTSSPSPSLKYGYYAAAVTLLTASFAVACMRSDT